ncbi:hypothetical protein MJM83_29205, partial [Salmonella enterica subsp. enterica serovar Montevideo]|nr:hypothetical protein [Salmonella enterica subsp. enterica serovar Montevideo]
GILVQSALLGQDDVLAQLIAAYRRFHLPARLSELDVDIHNTAAQRACSAKDAGGPLESSVMNDQIYQRIEDSARFRELVEKRQRF